MKTDKLEDLELLYTEKDDTIKMEWRGLSTLQNPTTILEPYLKKTAETFKGKNIEIDFTNIQFINSSSFVTICSFITLLNTLQVHTKIIYDESRDWQRFSFSVLKEYADEMDHVSF